MNWRERTANIMLHGIVSAGATLTWKAQYTQDDIRAVGWTDGLANWTNHPTLTGLTATDTGTISYPVTAVKFVVTARTSGTLTPQIIQSGAGGS
jgi:hypothetical protein